MNLVLAVLVVMIFLFIGEWVSKATRTIIPSVFVSAILFLIGFWTFLPKNVASLASFGKVATPLCFSLTLVDLGTIISVKKLIEQWKAVCIALLGVCFTLILTLSIGTYFFNWHLVIAAVPPLTGGLVSALLMTQGLKAQGLTALLALPVCMFVIHSIFGYPLTTALLRSEGRHQIGRFRNFSDSQKKIQINKSLGETGKELDLNGNRVRVPANYRVSSYIIAKVALVCVFAYGASALMHNIVNPNVLCILFGVIAHQIGFLESKALKKAGVFYWLIYGVLISCFSQLSHATPKTLGIIIIPILVLIVLGIIGMFIGSFILSHFVFKNISWQMAFATALTALFGYPSDYIVTTDVIKDIGKSKGEREFLTGKLLPPMIIGGVATVSVASVIIASIFLKFL